MNPRMIGRMRSETSAPRPENTSMPVIRIEAETVGLPSAIDEMRDQPDFDHDVAGAEAGEIEHGERLARRLGEDRAPAEATGMTSSTAAVTQATPSVAQISR